jgi:hypothetical protein
MQSEAQMAAARAVRDANWEQRKAREAAIRKLEPVAEAVDDICPKKAAYIAELLERRRKRPAWAE